MPVEDGRSERVSKAISASQLHSQVGENRTALALSAPFDFLLVQRRGEPALSSCQTTSFRCLGEHRASWDSLWAATWPSH